MVISRLLTWACLSAWPKSKLGERHRRERTTFWALRSSRADPTQKRWISGHWALSSMSWELASHPSCSTAQQALSLMPSKINGSPKSQSADLSTMSYFNSAWTRTSRRDWPLRKSSVIPISRAPRTSSRSGSRITKNSSAKGKREAPNERRQYLKPDRSSSL